jgi:hypothetical protein
VARRIGTYASGGKRPDPAVPAGLYRAVAYESEDTFQQPIWMCSHDHRSSQEAEICGAEWLKDHTALDDAHP